MGSIFRHGDFNGSNGRALAHKARSLLNALQRQMLVTGQKYGSARRTLPDGTQLQVAWNKNGPVPVGWIRAVAPGIEEEPITVQVFIVDRGCAMVVDGDLRVYLSTEDFDYFQGDGDVWEWGITQHAQGIFYALPGSTCDSGKLPPFWDPLGELQIPGPGDPPGLIDEDTNSYLPTIARIGDPGINAPELLQSWINDGERGATVYTGLMRFAVQVAGPNFNIKDWRPGSLPAWSPDNYGLLRFVDTDNETYRYWIVYIGSAGVFGALLQHDPTVDCLVEGLYEGLWTGEKRLNAEASVIATLRLAPVEEGEEQGVLLIAEEGMVGVHDSDYSPIQHGWHYSTQEWESNSEEETAAIALCVDTEDASGFLWNTRRCTITFSYSYSTLNGPMLSAIASFASDGETSLYYKSGAFVQQEDGLYQRVNFTNPASPQGGDIYGTYPPSGPNWIPFGYESFPSGYPGTPARAGIGGCGGGASSTTTDPNSTASWRLRFGPRVGELVYTTGIMTTRNTAVSASGGGTTNGWFRRRGVGGQLDGYSKTIVTDPVSLADDQCNETHYTTTDDPNPAMKDASVTISHSACTYKRNDISFASNPGNWGLSFLWTLDPTVYIVVTQLYKKTNSAVRDREWDLGNLATSCFWSGENGAGSASFAWGVVDSPPIHGARGTLVNYQATPPGEEFDDKAIATSVSSILINPGSPDRETEVWPDDSHLRFTKANMYVGDRIVNLADVMTTAEGPGSVWRAFLNFGAENELATQSAGPDAVASYTGELIYRPDTLSSYQSDDGYDTAAVEDSVRVRFLL